MKKKETCRFFSLKNNGRGFVFGSQTIMPSLTSIFKIIAVASAQWSATATDCYRLSDRKIMEKSLASADWGFDHIHFMRNRYKVAEGAHWVSISGSDIGCCLDRAALSHLFYKGVGSLASLRGTGCCCHLLVLHFVDDPLLSMKHCVLQNCLSLTQGKLRNESHRLLSELKAVAAIVCYVLYSCAV